MQRCAQGLRHFLLAVQFLTRIPVTGRLAEWVGYSPAMLNASSAYFPAVGWVVGAWVALWLLGLSALLPSTGAGLWLAAVAAIAASAWLTGAFHEDGLADMADGLGGSAQTSQALAIMKDSRLGSYGSITLVLALLLRLGLLVLLAQQGALALLVGVAGVHAFSRLAPLVVMRSLPYVRDTDAAKAKPLAQTLSAAHFRLACCWAVPAPLLWALVIGWGSAAMALLLWALALWRVRALLQRRLQGFTGDTLGAVQQVCELALYLGLVLQWPQ